MTTQGEFLTADETQMMGRTPTDRFWSKVNKGAPSDCWQWTDALNKAGYGRLMVSGKLKYAHVLSYELANGSVPDGLEVDHTCHNLTGCVGGDKCQHRSCVNPSHLESVAHIANVRRGNLSMSDTCSKGHSLESGGVYSWTRKNGSTARRCRTCFLSYQKSRRQLRPTAE